MRTCLHSQLHRRAADSAAWNYAQQRHFALAYARFVTARALLLLQSTTPSQHSVFSESQQLAPELPVPSVVLTLSTELISCSELVAALQAVNAAAGEQMRRSTNAASDTNSSSTSSSGVCSGEQLQKPVGPPYPFVAV
jgi:hypothetical protein